MRTRYTRLLVLLVTLFIVAICVGWAVMVQHVVPTACSYPTPPPHAQYLDCP
jgi:hypothetical protein